MNPTVSVVVPVYGVERHIRYAISSVLAQTFADFEIVVVDDGCRDGSIPICRAFGDPRIRIASQPNAGLAAARNTGIRASRGVFVALLDGDDAMMPDKLERHVRHFMVKPNVGVSYAGSRLVDECDSPIGIDQTPMLGRVDAVDVFCGKVVRNGSVPVFRRRTLDDASIPAPDGGPHRWFFDERLRRSEDVEFWTRVALTTAWRFEGLKGCLTEYRVNAGGLSADVPRQLASWDAACSLVSLYAPDFVARNGSRARALELRYLARRSFRTGDGKAAVSLMREALTSHPSMLVSEPIKTATTLAACVALKVLPPALLGRIVRVLKPGLSQA